MTGVRIETMLLTAGILVGVVGFCLVLDAWVDDHFSGAERRRFRRLERDRKGEALVGLGVLSIAATIVGGAEWRYSVIAAIAGSVLMLWGVKRNARYIRAGLRRS
jgi:hypothetical protein